MAEYLEKETFKSWMKENITENPMILTAIDYAPSADVEPVRHGHWVEHDEDIWSNEAECSECHKRISALFAGVAIGAIISQIVYNLTK